MTSTPLPDAGSNWVDRHAPEGLKPWLKLGRFDRPIGIWLLLLPGWQGIALAVGQFGWETHRANLIWLVLAFAVGAALMRAAGCAFNDIVDRDIDARVARTAQRPVASGRISVKQAWAFILACSLTSLLILLTLGETAILLGVGSLALVAAYPFMKRITWWPQAWLGLTFNWGALMGFAAAFPIQFIPTGPMDEFIRRAILFTDGPVPLSLMLPALLLYAGGVFWTLGYDTLYALQDIEDDVMAGVKSSARRLGANVPRGVGVFYALAAVLAGMAGLFAGLGPAFWIGWALYALHLGWQTLRVPADDGSLALKLFKSNRTAGLILLAAIILGAVSWPM